MVAVGTTNFINPDAPKDILAGIKSYMKKNKIKDIKNLIGSGKRIMTKKKAQLIVALDVYSLEKVRQLVDQLVDYVDYYKVGSQLFYSVWPYRCTIY